MDHSPGALAALWRARCPAGPLVGVFVTDTELHRIHSPYDGGADVVLATPGERDRLRDRHVDWLSGRPSGL
ncbi:DUF3885 domain-containing protein [Streptomyces ambofaciens]